MLQTMKWENMQMKKHWMVLFIIAMALPVFAQKTNAIPRSRDAVEKKHSRLESSPWTEKNRKEYQERKYQFMSKMLSNIGVSDDDKIKIRKLQEAHRQKMKANTKRSTSARKKLSRLQDQGANEKEIEAAIQDVVDAFAEQIRILVGNRREMEKILGKEKYALFMQDARAQFKKHGQRGGSGMPPRPGLPPLPNTGKTPKTPPLPNTRLFPPPPS